MSEESKILDLKSVEAIRDWVKGNFVAKNELVTLGLVSQLYVTFDEDFVGQTYSITGGDKTYSGVVPESKEVIVLVNAPNTVYTVACPNDEGTECTCKIQVGSQNGRYAGKLECFKAYLHVQAEAGAAVTATVGDYSYTGAAGEDGYCTLTVKRVGTYSVTAKLGIRVSDAVTVEVSESGVTVEVVCQEIPKISWKNGTDEEIAAIIDAAHTGEIDLQTDAGWKVGDARTIRIGAFVGGNGNDTNYEEQDIDIVISSFEDYENCGCKMQFDFKQALAPTASMYLYRECIDGYKQCFVYRTVLPKLVQVLPVWLSERLIAFNVKMSEGNTSTTIETLAENKLALRSEVEVFGETQYSVAGEGEQIEYYKIAENRIKTLGITGKRTGWWERSPNGRYQAGFCNVTIEGDAYVTSAKEKLGVSPFGCL